MWRVTVLRDVHTLTHGLPIPSALPLMLVSACLAGPLTIRLVILSIFSQRLPNTILVPGEKKGENT